MPLRRDASARTLIRKKLFYTRGNMEISGSELHEGLREIRAALDAEVAPDLSEVSVYDTPIDERGCSETYGFDPAEEDGNHFSAAFSMAYGLGHDLLRYAADEERPPRLYWNGNRRKYVDRIDEVDERDNPRRKDWNLFTRLLSGVVEGVEQLGVCELDRGDNPRDEIALTGTKRDLRQEASNGIQELVDELSDTSSEESA